jgi:hypothetical protein
MPLRDHFHPPVSNLRHWSEIHGQWPAEIVRTLFDILPQSFQAGSRVYLGSSFEVDVSVAEDDHPAISPEAGTGDIAAVASVEPPVTVVADKLTFDDYEVRVYDSERRRTLVAAIEIVSPSNKDRPETRAQFVGKCAALLREGVCVSVVDVVSDRLANLYAELLARVGEPDPRVGVDPSPLYAATVRARKSGKNPPVLDLWYYPLSVGQPLPTIPLWLAPTLSISLPLEPSYQEVCRLLRIP